MITLRTLQRQIQKIKKGTVGPAGEPGEDGSTVLIGVGPPSEIVGNEMDIWIEKDLDDVVLKTYQKVFGNWNEIGDINPEWADYTPVYSAEIGTLTTVTTHQARYRQIGSVVFLRLYFTIVDDGTASGNLIITLPVEGIPASGGSGTAAIGSSVSGLTVHSTDTIVTLSNAIGGNCIQTGSLYTVSITYEAA